VGLPGPARIKPCRPGLCRVLCVPGRPDGQTTIQFKTMTVGSHRLSVFPSGSRLWPRSGRRARPSVPATHPAPCCCWQIAQRKVGAHGRRSRPHRPPDPPRGRLPVRAGLLRLSSLPRQLRSLLLSQGNPPPQTTKSFTCFCHIFRVWWLFAWWVIW
jgi:hypothetical protein